MSKEYFVQLQILRQLQVWVAASEKTFQSINTGHNVLTNAVRSLGRAMPAHEPIIFRLDPVIRYLWLILHSALKPKSNGDSIRFVGLG